MGNSEAKEKDGGQIDYERLGPVTVREIDDTETGEKISIMEFTRSVESEKAYQTWKQSIERIDDTESQEILLIPSKHSFEKAGMCGSNGLVKLTFDNFPFVLNSEINNRKRLERYFLETEMWYLLYNIIRAGNKFEKIKKKIGDVNPHNVLINDDGQIKVLSTVSLPGELDNFQKAVEKDIHVYLAPQELDTDAINKGEYPNGVDPCRAEVFSIGLTILSSGILEDCRSVYNGYKINEQRLNQFLGAFKQKYSNYLFTTVVSMLAIKPQQRRRASDIYNQLSPHENAILDLEQFMMEQSRYGLPQSNTRPVSQQLPPGVHPYYDNRNTQPPAYSMYPNNGGQIRR